MRDFKIFCLRFCFMLFTSAQLSNADRVKMTDPDNMFAYTATIDSLYVKEPNQDEFTRHSSENQMLLSVHKDRFTLSFYESGARDTFLTFKQRLVDFEIFHDKSMTFRVRVGDQDYFWHFRCVFSAPMHTVDIFYSYLSVCTGHSLMTFRMEIKEVESYVRINQTRSATIQTVEDLKPAALYEQEISKDDPTEKIFSVTPSASMQTEHKLSRLVFRTGTFTVRRVNEKVVLELAGFSDRLYIFYFPDRLQAQIFLDTIDETGGNAALDITPDMLSYLDYRPPRSHVVPRNESKPQSSSGSDEDDPRPRTLQLANWSVKHSRGDEDSSRNVRNKSRS